MIFLDIKKLIFILILGFSGINLVKLSLILFMFLVNLIVIYYQSKLEPKDLNGKSVLEVGCMKYIEKNYNYNIKEIGLINHSLFFCIKKKKYLNILF